MDWLQNRVSGARATASPSGSDGNPVASTSSGAGVGAGAAAGGSLSIEIPERLLVRASSSLDLCAAAQRVEFARVGERAQTPDPRAVREDKQRNDRNERGSLHASQEGARELIACVEAVEEADDDDDDDERGDCSHSRCGGRRFVVCWLREKKTSGHEQQQQQQQQQQQRWRKLPRKLKRQKRTKRERRQREAKREEQRKQRRQRGKRQRSHSIELELERVRMHENFVVSNKEKFFSELKRESPISRKLGRISEESSSSGDTSEDQRRIPGHGRQQQSQQEQQQPQQQQQQQQQQQWPLQDDDDLVQSRAEMLERSMLIDSNAAIECRDLVYHAGFGPIRRLILQGVSFSVPEGSIYALLGPSGCGKTTVLRCIAGRLAPSLGSLRVFGFRPNEPGSQIPGPAIGYMPQDSSLYEDFSIYETLAYFGRINRMRSSVLDARIDFLVKFLDLPEKWRLIRTLSGGQKRRVSLAVALIHSPPLLILDEPTVGVDPLLRQLIWKYLVTLAGADKITIVITTHYIEEARQADVVGLMRKGRLLAEDKPLSLMAEFQQDSLEKVFLQLCLAADERDEQNEQNEDYDDDDDDDDDENDDDDQDDQDDQDDKEARHKEDNKVDNNDNDNDKDEDKDKGDNERHDDDQGAAIKGAAEATKASRKQMVDTVKRKGKGRGKGKRKREPGGGSGKRGQSTRTLKIYHSTATLTNSARGPTQTTLIGISRDLKTMERGQKYAPTRFDLACWLAILWAVTWKNFLRLRRNRPVLVFEIILPAFQVLLFCLCIGGHPFGIPLAVVNDEMPAQASQLFLNSLSTSTFTLRPYDNLTAAIESVKRGYNWAVVHIPASYTKHLNQRLLNPIDATNETLANGTIHIYPDLTNLHLAATIENAFRVAFEQFARESLQLLGYDAELADLPIKVMRPIYGAQVPLASGGYLEFMAPGVIISITYVMATGLTALAFIMERRDGQLERAQVSGVSTCQILLGHALLQVTVMLVQVALVLGITFCVFGIPSRGPILLVALLVLLQGCTGMAYGLLISAVCRQENTAVMLLVGTFYVNLILAGIIWPIEAMPKWLRILSYAQPQTLPVEGLRNILSRGWSIDEPSVQCAFLVSIGWLVLFLLSAGACMRYIK